MLSTDKFKAWGKKYVLFCHITSQVTGEKNPRLLSEKGGRGFPYLVFMDAAGEVLGQPAGRSVEAFDAMGKSLSRYQELAGKSELSKEEKKELFLIKVKIGKFKTGAEARTALKALGLSEEENKQLENKLADLDVMAVLKGIRRGDRAGVAAAAEKFAGWAKKGYVPTSNDRAIGAFWQLTMGHAEKSKDADLFEKALKALKAKFGSNPRAARFFQNAEKKLAELRAGGGAK